MNKLKGFTLSEILIAMLVLGIIIAASVPVILQMTPNKNAVMMKKAYYATETIIQSLINDENYYPDKSADGIYGFEDNTAKTVTGTAITAPANNKLQCLFASKLNIKEDLAAVCAIDPTANPVIVTTMDGMSWNLSGLSNSAAKGCLSIDVDGADNGVSAYFGGACPDANSWSTGVCTGAPTGYKLKKVDRIEIGIANDGRLSITGQGPLVDILSGKTKLIGSDEDK